MDTCVCCGAIIPEGTQICWECSRSYRKIAYKTNILLVFKQRRIGKNRH